TRKGRYAAALAVGLSSSQSLRVQVGARYRDQDPDSASSLGRCLLAPGMNYLTHRAAPPFLLRAWSGISKPRPRPLFARPVAARVRRSPAAHGHPLVHGIKRGPP